MAEEGKPSGNWCRFTARIRAALLRRRDLHIPEEIKQSAIGRARAEGTQALGRYRVQKKEFMDGVKFFLDARQRKWRGCVGIVPCVGNRTFCDLYGGVFA